jgi:hypothetical protein
MKSHVVAGGIFRRGRIHALTITVSPSHGNLNWNPQPFIDRNAGKPAQPAIQPAIKPCSGRAFFIPRGLLFHRKGVVARL